MNICFRVDSSTIIGTGHVMRCLTIAEELRKNGHHVTFIGRLHKGNLHHLIGAKGFQVHELAPPATLAHRSCHASWLGTSPEQDVKETIQVIQSNCLQFDWIIIDHYAIDMTWEQEIRKYIPRIMVIDDLADRVHDCDILLDQNYYVNGVDRYTKLVPTTCSLLLGPTYSLLRDEFLDFHSLPKQPTLQKTVLIMYGGSDPTNETLKAIHAVNMLNSSNLNVHVVVGPSNPNKDQIKKLCKQNNYSFHYHIDYMAKRIHEADFAICAGGSTTWERLCLGTPGILTAIADNQVELCENVEKLGIDHYLGRSEQVSEQTIKEAITSFIKHPNLSQLSLSAKKIVDGQGKRRVIAALNKKH